MLGVKGQKRRFSTNKSLYFGNGTVTTYNEKPIGSCIWTLEFDLYRFCSSDCLLPKIMNRIFWKRMNRWCELAIGPRGKSTKRSTSKVRRSKIDTRYGGMAPLCSVRVVWSVLTRRDARIRSAAVRRGLHYICSVSKSTWPHFRW